MGLRSELAEAGLALNYAIAVWNDEIGAREDKLFETVKACVDNQWKLREIAAVSRQSHELIEAWVNIYRRGTP